MYSLDAPLLKLQYSSDVVFLLQMKSATTITIIKKHAFDYKSAFVVNSNDRLRRLAIY